MVVSLLTWHTTKICNFATLSWPFLPLVSLEAFQNWPQKNRVWQVSFPRVTSLHDSQLSNVFNAMWVNKFFSHTKKHFSQSREDSAIWMIELFSKRISLCLWQNTKKALDLKMYNGKLFSFWTKTSIQDNTWSKPFRIIRLTAYKINFQNKYWPFKSLHFYCFWILRLYGKIHKLNPRNCWVKCFWNSKRKS